MKEHRKIEFETIPISKRRCSYSKCICHQDELWTVPNYQVGQVWAEYGAIENDIVEIKIVGKRQIIGLDKNGDYHIFKYRIGEYATSGTPSLRIRLS